jgi:small subunit ribosomal protein S21
MACNYKVIPRRNESIERVVKRFNKKFKKLGIIDEARERRHFIKPSERKRKAKKRSDARRRKELAKQRKQTI